MSQNSQFTVDRDQWAVLVPEFIVSNIYVSKKFWCSLLGFSVRFERPEDGFAYLQRGHAQVMLEQLSDDVWLTGLMEPPFGRGINLQIEIPNVEGLYEHIVGSGVATFRPLRTSWYREGEHENGQMEFLIQDPDGYLLRFIQHLGQRPTR